MPLRLEDQVGPSTGPALWYAIYQVGGKHVTYNSHLLQKFVQTPQQCFCNFYKSVAHEKCKCHRYELMMERTPAYRIPKETQSPDQGAREREEDIRGADEVEVEEDPREVRDKLFSIIVECQDTTHRSVRT